MNDEGGIMMTVLFQYDWFALLIVGFATMFLVGELIVNMRGLFALIGIVLISSYFYYYLGDLTSIILMAIVYFFGLLFIFIDGKILNDGTLAILGAFGMIIAVGLTAPTFTAGLYAVIGIVLGIPASLIFIKFLPKRKMWQKIALKDRLTKEAGYSSINEEYGQLLNKKGVTMTDLRPVGKITIDDKEYSAQSEAQWIHKGTEVVVVAVDGTKIVVRPVES